MDVEVFGRSQGTRRISTSCFKQTFSFACVFGFPFGSPAKTKKDSRTICFGSTCSLFCHEETVRPLARQAFGLGHLDAEDTTF